MASVCLYFQVHQPDRLDEYSVFDIGEEENYFANRDDTQTNNEKLLRKVSEQCYRPTNKLLLELLDEHPELQITFSFSGVVLDQLEEYDPETLALFQELVDTGQVEVLSETYHHSLAFFFDQDEFEHQVELHRNKIQDVFGQDPSVFRNTELAYNNDVGRWADEAGFDGVLAEGWEEALGWRSSNFVYQPPEADIPLLLKNYRLSDDIAFRFSREDWEGWPLTAEKFARWVSEHNGNGEVINLFMDYETFGEHQWADTGIFDFLRQLPAEILSEPDTDFRTVSGVIDKYPKRDTVDVQETVTWADTERDLSAWLGNSMQNEAARALYDLGNEIKENDDSELADIRKAWRRLQTSDHFYYMCTKWASDGDVHAYFNPYESPYDAYITYMNVLTDLRERTQQRIG
jgi:alpha-amylase